MADTKKTEDNKVEVKPEEKAPAATETADNKQEAKPSVPEGYVPVAAVQDERKKRQAKEQALAQKEQELAYLRGQLEAKTATPVTKTEEAFDETEYFTKPGKVVKETAAQEAKRLYDESEKARRDKVINFSRNKAIRNLGDEYLEMEQEFAALVRKDQTLIEPVGYLDDPASYVIEIVKAEREKANGKNETASLKARIAELEEKIKNGGAPVKETMPASNAGARGSGASSNSALRRGVRDDNMLDAMLA